MMELRLYPDPVLSKKCEDVEISDESAKAVLEEMSKYLYEWNGAGLAAPQVGILKKMVVIDVRDEPAVLYKMINPKIVWHSDEIVESKEGCLSLPILREKIKRYERVTVEYLDENFGKHEITADGFLACCLQHEIDHLSGKLYIDHLSRLRRNFALKKFAKLQKEAAERGEELSEATDESEDDDE